MCGEHKRPRSATFNTPQGFLKFSFSTFCHTCKLSDRHFSQSSAELDRNVKTTVDRCNNAGLLLLYYSAQPRDDRIKKSPAVTTAEAPRTSCGFRTLAHRSSSGGRPLKRSSIRSSKLHYAAPFGARSRPISKASRSFSRRLPRGDSSPASSRSVLSLAARCTSRDRQGLLDCFRSAQHVRRGRFTTRGVGVARCISGRQANSSGNEADKFDSLSCGASALPGALIFRH